MEGDLLPCTTGTLEYLKELCWDHTTLGKITKFLSEVPRVGKRTINNIWEMLAMSTELSANRLGVGELVWRL